jgi:hypothetical protein
MANEQSSDDEKIVNRTKLKNSDNGKIVIGSICLIVPAFLGIVFYALDSNCVEHFFSIASTSSLISGAFALLGILLGFLFGIPRTLSGAQDAKTTISYQVNTNLEQISDWLTKIIVGVGLTQLGNIPHTILNTATHLQTAFPTGCDRIGFIVALMIYSVASGFLMGYVWTRVILAPMFETADKKLFKREEEVKELKNKLELSKELKNVRDNMVHGLYKYQEQGFIESIGIADNFLKKWGKDNIDDVIFWIRLACAYALKYKWEVEHDKNDDAMKQAKEESFKAIDKALSYDKELAKFWLEALSNRNPNKDKDKDDGGLEVFWDDPEFQKRLKA